MANISAADVYKLRDLTGAGVMDCKGALVESEGDFDKAIEILRKKGQKLAMKRADREANEGVVVAAIDDAATFGAVLMMNCETDFVAKNDDFNASAKSFLDAAIAFKVTNLDALLALQIDGRSINDLVTDLIGKIGEKISVSHYEFIEAPLVSFYNHHSHRISTLVGFTQAGDKVAEAGKDVAMQIAAMNPVAVDKDFVPQSVIDKEIEIGKEQARQEGKPEEMLEKIAQGKLNKFFKESTLLNQDFIKDGSMTVGKYLTTVSPDLSVTKFFRLALGE
ncbi:MAG: elongation factor Ts [Bacteroidetes bacterium HGW-Bacteroidetes-6]|jgi:elongation factor Ts|nr:MAG: elongation factor Ts [Bacteroidetes bacterium HGW-Bacteroidetes-6]